MGSAPDSPVPRPTSHPTGVSSSTVGSSGGTTPTNPLLTYEGRQDARAAIVAELAAMGDDKVSLSRATALAAALRGIDRIENACLRREEDLQDAEDSRELRRIRENQARMRTGGVTEDEAPQLPRKRETSTG